MPAVFVLVVIVLDRLTKWIIQTQVSVWDSYTVIPNFFSIVHTQNPGAAFGLFSESSSEWRSMLLIGLSFMVMVFVAGMLWQSFRAPAESRILQLGLALVLGGALGNLYDRIVDGSVTDFLLFYIGEYQWPAFNVADSAISIGAGLLILDMWKYRRPAVRA
jgi:signal peptidase II